MNISQGTAVMRKVRRMFAAGHKSDNKLYQVERDGSYPSDITLRFSTTELKKFWDRQVDRTEAFKNRPAYTPCRYDAALAILKLPAGQCSGNCDEMSTMSAYYAYSDCLVAKDRLFIADVTQPADHVFCVVTDGTPMTKSSFGSVTEFTTDAAAKKWLVIDPWLHVCCHGGDYLTKGNGQLNKWDSDGKRISWAYGSQGRGWYPAGGEYKDRFADGPVELVGFFVKRKP